MTSILADDNFKRISWMKMIEFRPKFVSRSPIDNKPPLVQVMALRLFRRQAIAWNNAYPVYRRIYAVLGGMS